MRYLCFYRLTQRRASVLITKHESGGLGWYLDTFCRFNAIFEVKTQTGVFYEVPGQEMTRCLKDRVELARTQKKGIF